MRTNFEVHIHVELFGSFSAISWRVIVCSLAVIFVRPTSLYLFFYYSRICSTFQDIKEGSFKVTRMRCWRLTTTVSLGSSLGVGSRKMLGIVKDP